MPSMEDFSAAQETFKKIMQQANEDFAVMATKLPQAIKLPNITMPEPEYTKYLKPILEAQRLLIEENKALRNDLKSEQELRQKADRKIIKWGIVAAVISGSLGYCLTRIFG